MYIAQAVLNTGTSRPDDLLRTKIYMITCDSCHKKHNPDSDRAEFFTIRGNIYVGLNQGWIGDNIDVNGRVSNDNHYCRECFKESVDLILSMYDD